jgi:hypothetical protein
MHAIAISGPPPTPTQLTLMILFGLVWLVVSTKLVAMMSGWTKLVPRFRHGATFTGTTWRWQSAKFRRGMRYNNGLTIGASPEGLYLATMPVLSFGHAPLLIPWNEITEQAQNTLFGPVFVLTLGSEERVQMTIRPHLALKIEQAKGQISPVV